MLAELFASVAGAIGAGTQLVAQATVASVGVTAKATGQVAEIGAGDIKTLGAVGRGLQNFGDTALGKAGDIGEAGWGASAHAAVTDGVNGLGVSGLGADILAKALGAVNFQGMERSVEPVASSQVVAAVAPLPQGVVHFGNDALFGFSPAGPAGGGSSQAFGIG